LPGDCLVHGPNGEAGNRAEARRDSGIKEIKTNDLENQGEKNRDTGRRVVADLLWDIFGPWD
jgi:hypothetical protein